MSGILPETCNQNSGIHVAATSILITPHNISPFVAGKHVLSVVCQQGAE